MHIILDTNALNAALSTVTKALPVRTTISVLEGIYMKADRKRLLLRCTDLNIQIETYVDAMIEKEFYIKLQVPHNLCYVFVCADLYKFFSILFTLGKYSCIVFKEFFEKWLQKSVRTEG